MLFPPGFYNAKSKTIFGRLHSANALRQIAKSNRIAPGMTFQELSNDFPVWIVLFFKPEGL